VSNGIEYADKLRGDATFPEAWGRPRGAWYSEERAAWVRECVRKYGPDRWRPHCSGWPPATTG
jgi:hypothetical protein